MIVCPHCLHQNLGHEKVCQACQSELPATTHCSTCGGVVQADANFCGQCGSALTQLAVTPTPQTVGAINGSSRNGLLASAPLATSESSMHTSVLDKPQALEEKPPSSNPFQGLPLPPPPRSLRNPEPSAASGPPRSSSSSAQPMGLSAGDPATQLQNQSAYLLHVQTNVAIDLPSHLTVIHIGKPNDRVPPDIDIAGFPNSEIVSRVHADMRLESDTYYIEDVGSANGTYINNLPLSPGNRHRLRPGDRISLGKGDLMTFLFQVHRVH